MTLDLKDPTLLRQQAYIGGKWVDADSRETVDVTNPASGEKLGTVPKMGQAETRRAIDAAAAALPAWAAKTARERAAILRKWYDLMLTHQEDLAKLMTAEQGKPLAESKGEILYSASFLEWFGEEGKRLYGDIIPGHQPVGQKRICGKGPCRLLSAAMPPFASAGKNLARVHPWSRARMISEGVTTPGRKARPVSFAAA